MHLPSVGKEQFYGKNTTFEIQEISSFKVQKITEVSLQWNIFHLNIVIVPLLYI